MSETTIGCPTLPPYSGWWTATDEPLPLMGDGAGGGSVLVTGTFTLPSTPITPVQTSSSKASSSKTSSSATSSSSSPPPPPPNTGELCLGLLTAATSELATYAYITFNPGDPCSGTCGFALSLNGQLYETAQKACLRAKYGVSYE
ncbi:hypothetical protein TsFJ059_002306 [Trichoderma semiorbis]|uniref:Uncharacterized protein n=1 Tax=Trichoderma semiorbis TaxID=1491008 RepID=A0A9P8KUJ2_9HYPO|nr:hypothetical protein TsFJ059_002306 [Trichoderma semiorbis]